MTTSCPVSRPRARSRGIDSRQAEHSQKQQLNGGIEKQLQLKEAEAEKHASLHALRRRLEQIFTDASLATDHFLHCKIREALPEGGWVSCRVLCQCESLEGLSDNPRRALYALQSSHLEAQLSTRDDDLCDRVLVRRRQPLPPLLRKECQHPDNLLPAAAVMRRMVLEDRFTTMNRLVDQSRVQAMLGLKEVGASFTVFRERLESNPGERPVEEKEEGDIIAIGYERVIYGDGGAYVEVRRDQVCWEAWPKFFSKRTYNSYYDEYYTKRSHHRWQERWRSWSPNLTRGLLMLYAQVHPVADRPWAPGASYTNPHHERTGGYADYRPGYFYFAADDTLIVVENNGLASDTGQAGTNTASGDSTGSDSDTSTSRSASARST